MFLLQPLVENAIRHGIAARPSAGTIEIRAERKNGTVELCVCDDGPGLPDGLWAAQANGIGLSNTRARLDQLYPETHRLQLSNAAEGGFVVTVAIPFRTNADAAAKTSSER